MPYASSILTHKFGFGQQYDPDAIAYFKNAGISQYATTPSAYDNAANFNGINQYLSVTSFSLQTGTTDFSFGGWFNLSSNSYFASVAMVKGSATQYDYLLYFNNNGGISFQCDSALGVPRAINSGGAVFYNQWVYIICVYSLTNGMSIYANGNLVSANATYNGNSYNSGNTALQIANSISPYLLTGLAAGCAFWNRELSQSDITALYNSGNGLPYSNLTSSLKTNLISYWELNSTSVTADSQDSNTLTNNGSVTASAVGPIVTSLIPTQPIINSFVKGIKNLGLWGNFVCWPIRSSQNNNLVTQLSLGGLGTYPLVLANSPIISSSGLVFNGTNQYAKCSQSGFTLDAANYANAGQIVIFNPESSTQAYSMYFGQSNGLDASNLFGIIYRNNTNNNLATAYSAAPPTGIISNGSTNYLNWNVAYNRVSPSLGAISLNANTEVTASLNGYPASASQGLDYVGFAARAINDNPAAGRVFATMTASFGAFIGNITPTSLQMNNIYTLYKNTLGVGLVLP